jgi:pimeloyl-ACP methyl ester carboxylesterase
MRTLTLSGWAQPADALARYMPGSTTFDYSEYPSVEASFEGLQKFADVPYVIGWSMGGQLALRAIAAGVLKPKHLTLIGTPWQFVSDFGMGAQTFDLFADTYSKNPVGHKVRFHGLIAKGDQHAKRILNELEHHPDVENTRRWLPWLQELASYSFDQDKHLYLPPTLLIQGENDTIVRLPQALKFQSELSQITLIRWADTGHAPHISDPKRLLSEIETHRAQHTVAA